jgi:hypothetical protein
LQARRRVSGNRLAGLSSAPPEHRRGAAAHHWRPPLLQHPLVVLCWWSPSASTAMKHGIAAVLIGSRDRPVRRRPVRSPSWFCGPADCGRPDRIASPTSTSCTGHQPGRLSDSRHRDDWAVWSRRLSDHRRVETIEPVHGRPVLTTDETPGRYRPRRWSHGHHPRAGPAGGKLVTAPRSGSRSSLP